MKYKFLCCFILLVIVLSPMTLAYSTSYSWSVLDSSIETSAQSSANVQNDNFLNLDAESAILIEQNSGQILYSHNIHEKLHPASVTKIMSLLLIMEALDSGKITLETQIPCSENAANMGGSQIWLDPRENLSVNDMLKAIAVVSANDCVTAMAEYLGGSTENFVKMMNKRAKELGATNTHFANPNGLHLSDHYSTAYDLYLIFKEVAKHNEFFNIAGRSSSRIEYLGSKGEQKIYDMASTNQYIAGTYTLPSQVYMIGGKTGTTTQAGSCLILLTKNKDGELQNQLFTIQ